MNRLLSKDTKLDVKIVIIVKNIEVEIIAITFIMNIVKVGRRCDIYNEIVKRKVSDCEIQAIIDVY